MKTKKVKAIVIAMLGWAAILFIAACDVPSGTVEWGSDEKVIETPGQTSPVYSTTVSQNGTGTYGSGQYQTFYTFWADRRSGSVSMTMEDDSKKYTTSCSGVRGGFVAGRGWSNTSSNANRVIHYNGSYNSNYGGAFGVYGWTKNPLVEYYVCEKTGDEQGPHNSSEEKNGNGHQFMGTFYSDSSYYDIYRHYREGFPSIEGDNSSFWQYISVRTSPQTIGTITFANHSSAWSGKGMNLGNHNSSGCYQILFTEMWSPQNVNGDPLSGQTVSGSSSCTITDYHERPIRIKPWDLSGYLAVYYDWTYKSGVANASTVWYLGYTHYTNGYPSGNEVVLRNGQNGRYITVNNYDHAHTTTNSGSSASKFNRYSYRDGSNWFEYGSTDSYLNANGNVLTYSEGRLRLDYLSADID